LSFVYRLLLAHFLADFPLQPTELYRLKTESFWGSALHGLVFGLVALFMVAPGGAPLWGMVALLTAFHILIDHVKAEYFLRRGSDNLGSFLLDQAAHIGAIIGAAYVAPSRSLVALRNFLLPDRVVLVVAFLILSTFGGTIILYTLKRTIWPALSQGLDKGWREWAGVIERGAIVGLVLVNLWLLVPLVAMGKGALLFLRLKPKGGEVWRFFLIDILASAALASSLGWLTVKLPVGG